MTISQHKVAICKKEHQQHQNDTNLHFYHSPTSPHPLIIVCCLRIVSFSFSLSHSCFFTFSMWWNLKSIYRHHHEKTTKWIYDWRKEKLREKIVWKVQRMLQAFQYHVFIGINRQGWTLGIFLSFLKCSSCFILKEI